MFTLHLICNTVNVLFVSMNALNKEKFIHKSFIYYSMNLIFNMIQQ